MDPRELDRLFAEFLDGTLDEEGARQLGDAIRTDPQALEELADLQDLDIAAEALYRTDEERRKLAGRIMLSISDTGRRERLADAVLRDVKRVHRTRPPHRPALAAAAWAAAGLLLAAIFVLMPRAPRPEATRAKAEAPPAPTPDEAERTEAAERVAEIERRHRELQEEKRRAEKAQEADRLRRAEEELKKVTAQFQEAVERLKRAGAAEQQAKESLPSAPPAVPRPESTDAPLAKISRVDGNAGVLTAIGKIPAQAAQELRGGHGIQTVGPRSALALEYADGTRFELGADTLIRGLGESTLGKRLELARGVLSAVVTQQPSGRPLAISTPHGEAIVLGTTLRLLVDGSSTRLEVLEGTVRLKKSDGKAVEVTGGHSAIAAVGVDPGPRRFLDGTKPIYIELEEFGTARDAKPTNGVTWKLYLEPDPSASGGHFVAAPALGTELSGEVDLVKGHWYLWVGFRNEESSGPVTFQVFAGGKSVGQGSTSPGGPYLLWKRFEFPASGLTRIVLRSTFKGTPDPNVPRTPFNAVNRWDRICLVRDEGFTPK